MIASLLLPLWLLAALAAPPQPAAPQPAAPQPAPPTAGAAAPPAIRIDRSVGAATELALEAGQNRLLLLSEDIARVAVADPAIAITDENGARVPVGTIGNVEVKGPNVFQGYWQMPEKTRTEFRPDGFFITGDLGQLEADGYLRLVGRAKDLIISGGLNVYPKEIEEALDALLGVEESAVFGIPHPDFGEAVAAAVTAQHGASLNPESMIAELRAQLAGFKTPKRIYIVDELPRNAMSKVQKAVLREKYKNAFLMDNG